MRHCIKVFILLLMAILLIIGCSIPIPDLGHVYELPNGYQIVWGGTDISLISDDTIVYQNKFEGSVVPNMQKVLMASGGEYVGLVMVSRADIRAHYSGAKVPLNWYIVDEANEILYGPYLTEESFVDAQKELGTPEFGPWQILSSTTRVDPYILEFCYNDQFICVQNLFTEGEGANKKNVLEWYILDGIADVVYGPYYSEEEYDAAAEDLKVGELCDWISTVED